LVEVQRVQRAVDSVKSTAGPTTKVKKQQVPIWTLLKAAGPTLAV